MKKHWIALLSTFAILCVSAGRPPFLETVKTATGTLTVSFSPKATADSLGIPLYPGAKIAHGSVYTVKTDSGQLAQVNAQATLTTKAGLTRVTQFYRNALKGSQAASDKPKGKSVVWKGGAGNLWIVTISRLGTKPTSIEIRRMAKYKPVRAEYPGGAPHRPTRPMGPPRSI